LEIAKGADLSLQPGAILKIASDCGITINGSFFSEGNLSNENMITSLSDDEFGGDTDGNGSSSGSQQLWGGIYFSRYCNGSQTSISFTTFRFGGRSSITQNALLYFESCSPKMEFCTIEYAAFQGVFCHKNASPDFGGGILGSKGHNTFSGFSQPNRILVNNGTTDIFAHYNCWGSNDEETISALIYDKNDRSSLGIVHFENFMLNCKPTIPEPPVLIAPENETSGLSDTVIFKWTKPQFAEYYQLYIAKDPSFSKIDYLYENLTDTSIKIIDIDLQTSYSWKLRAVNTIGYGDFSAVFSFRTMDTTRPEKIKLLSPIDGKNDVFCSLSFSWEEAHSADLYRIEVALDPQFEQIYFSDDIITENIYKIAGLNEFSRYFWRVAGKNRFGWGEWSDVFTFNTKDCPAQMPPSSWQFENRTGANATILFRRGVDMSDLGFNLKQNDAIGVFYIREREIVCGGYAFWEGDKNIVVPVWGDNPQTNNIKDGFEYNEYMRFKIWRSELSEEVPVGISYEKGSDRFVPDKLSIADSILSLTEFIIDIRKGHWDMISSPVIPFYPFLDSLFDDGIMMNDEKTRYFTLKMILIQNIFGKTSAAIRSILIMTVKSGL
jgi:hypothetical protein